MRIKLRCILLQLAYLLFVSANYHHSLSTTIDQVVTTTNLPVGYIYYQSINAAFKVHLERKNWSGAKEACISEGGRLAVVDTMEKISYVKANKPQFSDVWVGIIRDKSHWVTADNHSRLSNLPWESNRPDSFGDCTAVNVRGDGLCNKICLWRRAFVCEIYVSTTSHRTFNRINRDSDAPVFE